MQVLGLIAALFKVWMLVDAVQRGCARCGNYWIWIILFPFGDVAYFFVVKIHDPEMRRVLSRLIPAKLPSLAELRFAAEHCPSIENKVRLARGLHAAHLPAEARPILEEVLKRDSENKEALYGFGLCCKDLGDPTSAISHLSRLVEKDMAYSDYEATVELAHLLAACGDSEKSKKLLTQLYQKSLRLDHAVLLAEFLAKHSEKASSAQIVEKALREYSHSPRFVRRKYRPAAKRAAGLLKSDFEVASR